MKASPVAIIGNNGKTGARVQQRLKAMNIPTMGVSRSSTPAFDWTRPETWHDALAGARAVYVTYQPDLAVPHAAKDIQTLTEVARKAGVNHIVLLSGRGESGAQRAEKILKFSGIEWNVVRASWFMQNFSESFMLEGILAGELALPADRALEPFVDVDDIADVAVAMLTQPELRNRVVEVTGPRAITFAECVNIISQATNTRIQYQPITIEQFINVLQKENIPDDIQWLMRELFTQVLDGRNTPTTTGIADVLKRPACSFQEYVSRTYKTGIWNPTNDMKDSA